jgi:hypothetical protein
MTKNGLRYPCYCNVFHCAGAERDYRTVDNHAARDAADRPLYPGNQQQEEISQEPLPAAPIPDPPYPEVPLEDNVSHVESLPNCHEPVYETVIKRTK